MAVTGVVALAGGGVLFAASSDPATAMAFHGVTTTRVLDTREGSGTPLGLGGVLDLVVPRLPDDATGIAVNVTVVDGTEASFLTMYPTGDARPTTSTINWSSAAAVANSATVLVHSDHSVRLYNLKGSVNVVLDLIGYYSPAPVGGATGPAGPLGRQGLAGADGTDGVDGANGVVGPVGALGQRGAAGQDGVNGVDGKDATLVYLYAYNTAAETVALNAAVVFNTSGERFPAGPTGITFDAPSTTFIVPTAGVYRVSFSVIGSQNNQLSIRKTSGAVSSDPFVFGAVTDQTNLGGAVLTLAAADRISIAYLSSSGSGSLNLLANIGGTVPAINAWIDIQQLSG
ncbi:MAG: hypothetical protein ACXV7I_11650 [Ilumatobacteraceae bacterium]